MKKRENYAIDAPGVARNLALGAADLRMSGPILLWGVFGRRFAAMKPA